MRTSFRLAAFASVLLSAAPLSAQAPDAMRFQGFLSATDGTPLDGEIEPIQHSQSTTRLWKFSDQPLTDQQWRGPAVYRAIHDEAHPRDRSRRPATPDTT